MPGMVIHRGNVRPEGNVNKHQKELKRQMSRRQVNFVHQSILNAVAEEVNTHSIWHQNRLRVVRGKKREGTTREESGNPGNL